MQTKGDVLKEMKKVCLDDCKIEYYSDSIEYKNAYFLCPTPEKDNFSNAKIVIILSYYGSSSVFDSDIAYIFSGPFDDKFTKNSVNVSKTVTCSVYTYSKNIEVAILNALKYDFRDEEESYKYEWQEIK